MAEITFLIAALATGSNPDNWSIVETLLSSVSADITLRTLDWGYQSYSSYDELGNGARLGKGYPRARWTFRGTRPEQRENLKDFCPSLSAQVYIRTPTNETAAGVRIWGDFLCWMHWTVGEELVGLEVVEMVELTFTHLEAI